MLYREIMPVCSEIHTKHINTLCAQNGELLNVKLVVHIVTRRLRWSRGSVLAFSTQVRGFKPGRSRRIFKGRKNSSARLPSEGK